MIGVVDYGAGNLGSIMNAFSRLGIPARFAAGPEELDPRSSPFSKLVFPGDGHFATVMESLEKSGYAPALKEWIAADMPFLGICVGLQILFETSEEAPCVKGLAVLPGTVRRFPGRKVPQIGWNNTTARAGGTLFAGIPANSFFYYIHSYYVAPGRDSDIAAEAYYYLPYCSAVERSNLHATQFHPEKSGSIGLALLRNWAEH